jgi:hypothetical protein
MRKNHKKRSIGRIGGYVPSKAKQKIAAIPQIEDTDDAEAVAQDATDTERTMRIAVARSFLARGLRANLEAGRAYNDLKPLFAHGEWIPFLKAEAALFGLSFRTLQEYMRMANEADERAKKEIPAFFPPATDPENQAINDATEQAQGAVDEAIQRSAEVSMPEHNREVDRPRRKRVRLGGTYRLPLFLTGDQKDNVDTLRNIPDWPEAELAIIATLERLFVRYGIVSGPDSLEPQQDPQVGTIIFEERKTDLRPGAATDAAQI